MKKIRFIYFLIALFIVFVLNQWIFQRASIRIERNQSVKIIRDITYRNVERNQIKLDLYQPVKTPLKPTPVIICIHGGAWFCGDKSQYRKLGIHLAETGYTCVSINYRLSREAKYPACLEDCREAINWIIKHSKEYHLNPNQMVLVGDSAGAYMASITGLTNPDRYKSIICYYGVFDLKDLITQTPRAIIATTLLFRSRDQALYRNASPINYVSPDAPPFLFIHGDHDTVVPISQSLKMKRALEKNRTKTEFITVVNADHELKQASNSEIKPSALEIENRVVQYIKSHVDK